MTDFQRSTITGDLNEVPGLGPATIKKLQDASDVDEKVTNTFQLVGKFLMLKGPDEDGHKVESNEHMQKFWHWLAEKGISSHRSAIVLAIAEKMNTMMLGLRRRRGVGRVCSSCIPSVFVHMLLD